MGYSVIHTGVLIGLFSAVGALGSYAGGLLAKRFRASQVFVFSLAATSVCGVLGIYWADNLAGVGFFLGTSLFVNLSSSINVSLAQAQCSKNKAMAAGIINGFNWGVVGLCLAPIGFLMDKFGVAPVLLSVSFIPAVVGVLYYRRGSLF